MKNFLSVISLFCALGLYSFSPAYSMTKDTKQDRDSYSKVVQNKIDSWDRIIKEVKDGKYSDRTFQRKVSPYEAKELSAELKTLRNDVSQDLSELNRAKGDEWKKWESRIQSRFSKMRREFKEAHAE